MPVTNTPIFPQSILGSGAAITHGTGTYMFAPSGTATGTMVPFLPAGANGSIVTAIVVNNTDTATCTAVLVLSTGGAGGTFVQNLGYYTIAGGGTATSYAVPQTNLLNGTQGLGQAGLPFDSCGNKILYVAAGSTLNIGLLNTIISTNGFLTVTPFGGNL